MLNRDMERNNLWAPWRGEYVKGVSRDQQPDCFLCDAAANTEQDTERLIVHRHDQCLIMLNRYPYNNGHLLVAPDAHLADLIDLTEPQRNRLMAMVSLAEQLLYAALNPQGVNIGINIGRCAGAGLPGHLHVHLVPRWSGDTNFMGVVGDVRVVPQANEQVYQEITAVLPGVLKTMEESSQ